MTLSKIVILLFLSVQLNAQKPVQIYWALNKPRTAVICTDADYTKFVTKVTNNGGSLSTTEKTAICTLIKQLKDSSLWTVFSFIYPFVGGSAASCAINLKDTVNYNITWSVSPTFSSNGVDFNGTTQYGNTNFNPNGILSLNSASVSFYSRENTTGGTDIGTVVTSPALNYIAFNLKANYAVQGASAENFTNTDTRGLFTISRTTSVLTTQYRNGASVSTSTIVSTSTPNQVMYIGARNLNAAASAFSDRQCAFAAVGSALTSAQSLTLYNIVQAFQTTLGRQV